MKKTILFLAFVVVVASGLGAQDSQINFEHAPWAEILQKAADENKVIFVDAYTTWCGPCKKMTREVFSQKAVADFYNTNFINVKMDMEKGEGPRVAANYNVMAYPTLLFIDGAGEVVHRAVGYHTTDQFIELGETAGTPGNNLAGMKKRYEFGDRSAAFLYDYTFALSDAMTGTHEQVAEQYLATQKDWSTEDNLTFLFRFLESTDSKMFDYFLDNKAKYVGLFGETPVARKLQYLVTSSIQENGEETALEQVTRLYKKVYPEKAEEMTSEFSMMYYLRAGDVPKYVDTTRKHFKKYGTENWENLNEAAWNFYEFTESGKDLKTAVKWAKKSVALNQNFYNTDTLAALYYRLGKKGKAIKTAEQAITLAKQSGDDYSATMDLLEMARAL